MARTVAELPSGPRITDHISLGVIARTFPLSRVRSALAATGKASVRQRDLPAQVVVGARSPPNHKVEKHLTAHSEATEAPTRDGTLYEQREQTNSGSRVRRLQNLMEMPFAHLHVRDRPPS